MSSAETRARLRREDDEEEAAFAAAFLDPYRLVRLASDTWWHPVVPRPAPATPEIVRDRLTANQAEEEEGA